MTSADAPARGAITPAQRSEICRIAGIYCDFLISKTRIIIEVDGHMAHTMHPLHGQDRASRDLIHGMAIATAGYTLIRLDESDIKNNTYPGKLAGL